MIEFHFPRKDSREPNSIIPAMHIKIHTKPHICFKPINDKIVATIMRLIGLILSVL